MQKAVAHRTRRWMKLAPSMHTSLPSTSEVQACTQGRSAITPQASPASTSRAVGSSGGVLVPARRAWTPQAVREPTTRPRKRSRGANQHQHSQPVTKKLRLWSFKLEDLAQTCRSLLKSFAEAALSVPLWSQRALSLHQRSHNLEDCNLDTGAAPFCQTT